MFCVWRSLFPSVNGTFLRSLQLLFLQKMSDKFTTTTTCELTITQCLLWHLQINELIMILTKCGIGISWDAPDEGPATGCRGRSGAKKGLLRRDTGTSIWIRLNPVGASSGWACSGWACSGWTSSPSSTVSSEDSDFGRFRFSGSTEVWRCPSSDVGWIGNDCERTRGGSTPLGVKVKYLCTWMKKKWELNSASCYKSYMNSKKW